MDTTAIVHEAYLKLAGASHLGAGSRVHFMRVASRAMRHILSNYARDRRTAKRGGYAAHVPLEILDGSVAAGLSHAQSETLDALDEALKQLELVDKRLSAVIECRFFGVRLEALGKPGLRAGTQELPA